MSEQKNELVTIDSKSAVVLFKDGAGIQDLLADIKAKASSIVPDVTTAKGRKEIASVAYAVAQTKTHLDGIGKALVDEYKEIPKKIDAHRKMIRDELDKLKEEVRAPLTAYENAEAARVAALQQRLSEIAQLGNMPVTDINGSTAEKIGGWLAQLEQIAIDDSWQEKQAEACAAKEAAILKVTQALEARKQYESQQAELELLRQEQANRDQEERERQVAELARQQEAERQLQERAEAQRRELAAQQQAEQARRDAELADQRRIEAEASAKRQAEEAAARAAEHERQRIAAEKEEADRQAKAREADRTHRGNVNRIALAALISNTGLSEQQGKDVISAICNKLIPNVSINY